MTLIITNEWKTIKTVNSIWLFRIHITHMHQTFFPVQSAQQPHHHRIISLVRTSKRDALNLKLFYFPIVINYAVVKDTKIFFLLLLVYILHASLRSQLAYLNGNAIVLNVSPGIFIRNWKRFEFFFRFSIIT